MSLRFLRHDSHLDSPALAHAAAILVVDDDPAFQLGLKTFLREYVGFERVFTARSGKEAIDLILSEPSIEVVTLDNQMPGMSGLEMLDTLGQETVRPLAVMMISGHASEELEQEFRSRRTDTLLTTHFLAKPVEFEKLEPMILAAHDQVFAARQVGQSPAPGNWTEVPRDPGSEAWLDLQAKLGAQSDRIATLEQEVGKQRRKWRTDFLFIALLVLLGWLANEFGLLRRLEPHWAKVRTPVAEKIDTWFAEPSETPAAVTVEPAIPPSLPTPPAPESQGQPL